LLVTQVTCTATDNITEPVLATFVATVGDRTAPSLTVSAPLPADATSPSGAPVEWTSTVSDAVTPVGDIKVTCNGITQAGGTSFNITFPFGDTVVACTAVDGAGNVNGPVEFTVKVEDRSPPFFTSFPGDQLVPAGSAAATHPVNWTAPSASDLYDTQLDIVCDPASGSRFPVNKETPVTCNATDDAGLFTSITFKVTVQDNVPPTLVVPASNFELSADSAAGAPWPYADKPAPSFGATYQDGDVTGPATCTATKPDGTPLVCAQGDKCVFPLGVTTINCTGSDANGNTAAGSFTVTVKDTTPPVITASNVSSVINAVSRDGAPVSFSATAVDAVDGPVPVVMRFNNASFDPATTWLPLVSGREVTWAG
jgi:hypothetical protein